jgi:hypothetical protein
MAGQNRHLKWWTKTVISNGRPKPSSQIVGETVISNDGQNRHIKWWAKTVISNGGPKPSI